MGKNKRQEDETERLLKQNRELKATNRSLMKQLKKLNKGYYKLREEETIEDVPEVVKKMCWDCGFGEYKEIIVHNRRWRACTNCGKRGKASIINGKEAPNS